MKRIIQVLAIFLLLSVLSKSCAPVTPAPIATILPSITVSPTHTSIPEPSATATPLFANKIFTIPTFHSMPEGTPMPLATPAIESSSMMLKGLPEKEFLDFIRDLNERSYEEYPPMFDWWTVARFIDSQEPVAIAIQEFLYRYPNSPNADELRWRLAFINSVVSGGLKGNQYGDEWMLGELKKSLDNQEVKPDQLENILKLYSFDVVYVEPIDNLFMDNQTAWLYQIVPQIWKEDEFTTNETVSIGSLFFVVRKISEDEFQLYLLNSAWALYSGESYVFDVLDHNGNGHPEIALYIGYHSGTSCRGNLLVYEWIDEQFNELTHSEVELRECTEGFTYSQSMDTPSIIYSAVIPHRTEIYSWDGQFYEWQRTVDIDSFKLWQYSYDKSGFSYSEEIEILRSAIESGEAIEMGPTYPDYLRYRMGVVYALQSKQDESILELQNLISSPVDTTRTVFSRMAKEFLKLYEGDKDVYLACRNSAKVFESALEPYRDSNGNVDDKLFQDIIGFSQDRFYFYELYLCNERDAFALLVDTIPSTAENLPSELQKNGVNLSYSQKIDANLDGKTDEWVVVFGINYYSFLVFPDGSYYHAAVLAEPIVYRGERNSSVQIDVETWTGFKNPVMVIQTEKLFSILGFDKNYESRSMFFDFDVTSHAISNQDSSPQFQLFYLKPAPGSYYPYLPWNGYRWDASQNEFKDDLLEFTLFVLYDPQTAVGYVDEIYPLLEDWKDIPDVSVRSLSYMYYLFGLSCELSGNEEMAVQIYWQLWRDFPESHFAILAKYKLEPITP